MSTKALEVEEFMLAPVGVCERERADGRMLAELGRCGSRGTLAGGWLEFGDGPRSGETVMASSSSAGLFAAVAEVRRHGRGS